MGRKAGRTPTPTPRGTAIRRLRQELGWSEDDLGRPVGLSGGVIHNLEKGWRKEPTREEAEAILAALELPPAALDMSEAFGAWVRAAAPPAAPMTPEEEDARRCAVTAGLVGLHVARALAPVLECRLREKRFARDRQRAEERCGYLRQLPSVEERRMRIQKVEDYQTWAMVERLALESERAAADTPARAIEWAELALFTVPFVPGSDSRRKRLEGLARFSLANVRRVGNDLDAADAAFQKARASWEAGEGDDLPLDEGWGLDLEASLRREQRRFPEALDLLARALEISPEERAGRILLNKAATLEQSGDAEAAIEALQQARPHVAEVGNPRDVWVLLFNLTVNLLHLSRLSEAEDHLSDAREVAIRLGNELDLTRTLWLEGRLDAALGRTTKAMAALEQVFDELVALALPYDAALAGLDLAAVHLEQEQTREVLALAVRIEAVFRTFRIEREALAALRVFCEAARQEEATVELARRTAEVIERVQREALPREGRGAGT